ncbi:TPA: ead/Ea22-like family protein [Enterobacter sichuanensis]
MSNIDKRALREAAEKATPGRWEYYPGNTSIEYNVDSMDEDQGSILYVDSGDFTQKQTDLNGAFIAAANPATILALLDELEAKDNRINRLEAIVAVAEQRNALMREWKRALKVPCDLADDQVPVVIHGMVIRLERLKETEAKLEAAEKRIAELRELLQWAHDTLLEINPNNYTHDDVCEINSASVEVILGIAPVLGETHGKSEEWWAARAAGTAKGE